MSQTKKCDAHMPPKYYQGDACPTCERGGGGGDVMKFTVLTEDEKDALAADPITWPAHYNAGKMQPLDIMMDAFGTDVVRHFCICNALKYILRHEHKGGDEDLKKAIFYLRLATNDDPRASK
jgi:Protein of unknwon function (DUF3310)